MHEDTANQGDRVVSAEFWAILGVGVAVISLNWRML